MMLPTMACIFSRTPILLDEVTEAEKTHNRERLQKIKEMRGLIPGNWRGRKGKGKRH
jgi:hypothetical protein